MATAATPRIPVNARMSVAISDQAPLMAPEYQTRATPGKARKKPDHDQNRQPTQAAPAAMMQHAAIRQAVRGSPRNTAPSNAANTTLASRSADTAPIGLACIAQITAP